MSRTILALAALLSASPAWAIDPTGTRPDPVLTPGAVRTADTAEICDKAKHTADVRNVSGAEKQAVYRRYGLTSNRADWCNSEEGCEVDHLVSLELGGSNDITNLWPEPFVGEWNAHDKDALENRLHKLVCAGRLDLTAAQTAIRTDWVAAYKQYVGPKPE
ncbi:HNH endonuclease [Methylobacterium terricola]|uniref:HNH endonuclease n=1 Tax=Methylobacterium terricola TaxID=2583531 RepID=A0A5C4LKF0_9HYPH|nr:HNH endonuclease signature motif containing protein [Methylobacterium terricola]TNC14894.1 HNH endonuclease [Methylobacterium terricola]